jgi:hypothetical protein
MVDNGHFLGRRHLGTRYDERNCHSQCRYCNRFEEGKKHIYARFLVQKYGEGIVELLESKAAETTRFSADEYKCLIVHYKDKIKGFDE